MNRLAFLVVTWICVTLMSCATTNPDSSTPVEPEVEEVVKEKPYKSDSRCAKFTDSQLGESMIDNYVIYRDFLKTNDWQSAAPYWKKVYAVSPAADGQRKTVFEDGIKYHHYMFENAKEASAKSARVDSVMLVYDHLRECNPQGTYIDGRKAFDYYYKYREFATNREIFDLFKSEYDEHGKKVPAFVVNPFVALLTEMYQAQELEMNEASTYANLVLDALKYNTENCEGVECEGWEVVNSYSPQTLQRFESERGFYDCQYFKDVYWEEWLADSTDCDLSRGMMARLRFAGCPDTDPYIARVDRVLKSQCRTTNDDLREGYACIRDGDYQCAISSFLQVVEQSDDQDKKAKYTLKVAQIYYTYLKNFPKARQYALEAAQYKDNWGEPYIMIGNLYASSGPLCGSGTGFESQRVVWVAIDQWSYAKSIDPSVAAEAQKNINSYAQYMPSVEDIFQRGLKEGESYFVPCWIQKSTRIRAASK